MSSWVFPATATESSAADVLAVSLEMHGRTTVVSLRGPVCAFTAPHLDTELALVADADRHWLVIDAAEVGTLSSDGVSVLVEHAQRCRRAGGNLVVRNPSRITRRVLTICGLDELLEPTMPPDGDSGGPSDR